MMEASPQRILAESGARWTTRLQVLGGRLGEGVVGGDRERIRADAWLILVSALTLFGRGHARSFPSVTSEEIRDLAAKKSLDLLLKLESRTWDLDGRSEGEIKAYLSRVVRNGLAGHVRQSVQFRELRRDMTADVESKASCRFLGDRRPPAADDRVESREFAEHLVDCVLQLKPRSGTVWFLRSLLELSSKEIAGRPDVGMNPGHVDVTYSRSRQAVGECMRRKGYDGDRLPSGTLAVLWREYWSRGKVEEDG